MFHSNAAQIYAIETIAARKHSVPLYDLLIAAFEAGRAYELQNDADLRCADLDDGHE